MMWDFSSFLMYAFSVTTFSFITTCCVPQILIYCILIVIHFNIFSKFSLRFHTWPIDYLACCLVSGEFPVIFMLLISSWILLWSESNYMTLILLNVLIFPFLRPMLCSILMHISWTLEKKGSSAVWWSVLWMSFRSCYLLSSSLSLLTFW